MKENRTVRGIRLTTFSLFLGVFFLILMGVGIHNLFTLESGYEGQLENERIYNECNDACNRLKTLSDELTTYSMRFCVRGDLEALNHYFEIVDNREREAALEQIESYHVDNYLMERAYGLSTELQEIEIHAMTLAALSYQYMDRVPTAIISEMVGFDEMEAGSVEQREMSLYMLQGDEYADLKTRIYDNLDAFRISASRNTEENTKSNSEVVKKELQDSKLIFLLIFASLIITMFVLMFSVVRVLRKLVNSVNAGEALKEEGMYELRYLARTLNNYYETEELKKSDLNERAEKDPLTETFNRTAFEKLVKIRMEDVNSKGGALAIVDGDNFKAVNDRFGHQTGDEAIKALCGVLKDAFRSNDIIGRYGGDEFLIWIDGITSAQSEYLLKRVDSINQRLESIIAEGGPVLSASMGVAFRDEDTEYDVLFLRADEALYRVKQSGRHGCRFWEKESK